MNIRCGVVITVFPCSFSFRLPREVQWMVRARGQGGNCDPLLFPGPACVPHCSSRPREGVLSCLGQGRRFPKCSSNEVLP